MSLSFFRSHSAEYTDMSQSILTQRQSVAFGGSVTGLKMLLERIGGAGTVLTIEPESHFRVFDCIDLLVEGKMLVLEWQATPVSDMFADTVMASLMQTELVGNTIKGSTTGMKPDRMHFRECLVETLQDVFGEAAVPKVAAKDGQLTVTMNERRVHVDLVTLEVRGDAGAATAAAAGADADGAGGGGGGGGDGTGGGGADDRDRHLRRMVETVVNKLHRTLVQTVTEDEAATAAVVV